MKSVSVLSFSFLLLFLISLVQPASAGTIDTSIHVVSSGIQQYFNDQDQKAFERSFGVSLGNTSQMEDYTPAQRLIFMIAAAEHHPLESEKVREQFASDFVWYYYAILWTSLILAILCILQKIAPEYIAGITNRCTGSDGVFDYYHWMETMALLAFLPVIALPTIEGLMEVEHTISSGMTLNSLEFLNINAGITGGIFPFEGVAYTCCGSLFALRIQYINEFTGNIMKIIFLFSIALFNSRGIAKIFIEWFLSALFMRPIVLWYSCKAVEHITSLYNDYGSFNATYGITSSMTPNEAYAQVWSTSSDVAGAIALDMSAVVILSFVTAFIFVLWPVIKFLLKVIFGYLLRALYKVGIAMRLLERVKRVA